MIHTNDSTHASHRRRRLLGLILVASAAVLVSARWDATAAGTSPGPSPLSSGTMTARLVDVAADGTVALDPLEVLSGAEAQQAAEAAGATPAGEPLPNDVYLHDPDRETLSLATDDRTAITVYDCTEACQTVPALRGELLDGTIRFYGGSTPVVAIEWNDGVVTSLAEVYLP